MKNKPKMKWKGREAKQAAEQGKRKALLSAAIFVEGEATVRTPVDTGNLRSSLTHSVDNDTARVGTNVEYAPYLEYGTDRMPAQAYLRPALDQNINRINKLMRDIIGREIRGI